MELSALSLRLRALSVLRGLLSHPLVRAYGDTLTALDGTAADFADRYGALCATRFSCGDIAQAVLDAVHFDTNTLTDTINAPEAAVLNAATHDLDVLNALLALDGEAQLRQTAAQIVARRLRLKDQQIARVAQPRRVFNDPGDQIAAHPGAEHRVHALRRDGGKPVGLRKAHPLKGAEAAGVLARPLQGLRAQIACVDKGAAPAAQQLDAEIAVIRADVGDARALRHLRRAAQQPVGNG